MVSLVTHLYGTHCLNMARRNPRTGRIRRKPPWSSHPSGQQRRKRRSKCVTDDDWIPSNQDSHCKIVPPIRFLPPRNDDDDDDEQTMPPAVVHTVLLKSRFGGLVRSHAAGDSASVGTGVHMVQRLCVVRPNVLFGRPSRFCTACPFSGWIRTVTSNGCCRQWQTIAKPPFPLANKCRPAFFCNLSQSLMLQVSVPDGRDITVTLLHTHTPTFPD